MKPPPPLPPPAEWSTLQAAVLARAGWRCQVCHRAGRLVAEPRGPGPVPFPLPRYYMAICPPGHGCRG